MVAIKTEMKSLPECCEYCQWFECRPHPYKGWTDGCGLMMHCMDDDQPEEWIYDGNGRPKACPLVEIDEEGHRQLAEWLKELKRADTLLKATYDLLNKQHENYYVLNLLAETVYYDEAECDGNCLMEDIDAWMEERGIDHDATRD